MKVKIIIAFISIFLLSCSQERSTQSHVSFDPANWDELLTSDTLFSASVRQDYFLMVKEYADFMIEYGRDRYGKVHSPLFATTMDRSNGDIFRHRPPKAPKGIRNRDRSYRGSNPSNHNGLYSILYKLTELTGNPVYAQEADTSLVWFFSNCQLKRTGLMPWGEHMGWDFFREGIILGKFQFWIHEMKGFAYWDLIWEEAPEEANNFALGLWNHQIYAHTGEKAGEFSRHANALVHQPFWGKGFPSHGGKYMEVWTRAWQETGNPEYLTAISTLLDYFERNISPESGALRYATKFPDHYSLGHNMGLARTFYNISSELPDSIARRMRVLSESTDPLYLGFNHDPGPGGSGFIKSANVNTLEPGEYRSEHKGGKYTTGMWSSGYGAGNSVGVANNCLERYSQTGIEAYRELFLTAAEAYYSSEIPESKRMYPGNYSGIISMMLKAYRLTGEKRFLDKATDFADISVQAVMDSSSPLPKASNESDHYEAITGANNLMNNLLNLWIELNSD